MPVKPLFLIGEELVKRGFITAEQLNESVQEQKATGERLGKTLVRLGYMTEKDLLTVLSEQLQIPFVRLSGIRIQSDAIQKLPAKFASHYGVMPFRLENNSLTVCTSDPLDVQMLDDIKMLVDCDIQLALASQNEIEDAIKQFYGIGAQTIEKMIGRNPLQDVVSDIESMTVENIDEKNEESSISNFVNQVILEALESRATDIHIEPYADDIRVRYRIDGVLHEATIPPSIKQFQSSIISRVKIMASMDIAEHRLPQDGRIKVKTKKGEVDLRVSVIPTPHGESVSIRLLTRGRLISLKDVGFSQYHLEIMEKMLEKPHGIIFLTGPTGSGKSTTLYAALSRINDAERKIITIEDPIEYQIKGVMQIQVQPKIGLTFSQGLRAMLRHDPDVMMVGEVRDIETAEITIRTALTGHLVFSTLHTNDACGAISRLLDMGVEPFLVASSVECIVAQRLVRLICPKCKVEQKIQGTLLSEITKEKIKEATVYSGKGCDACRQTGYFGRTAIHEMLVLTDELRQMTVSRASSTEIKKVALRAGMKTLREDGWEKIKKGITTIEEVLRVTQGEEVKL
jgi:type II secretion system protein E